MYELVGDWSYGDRPWLSPLDPALITRRGDDEETASAGAADGLYVERQDAVRLGGQLVVFQSSSTIVDTQFVAQGCPLEEIVSALPGGLFGTRLETRERGFVFVDESGTVQIGDDEIFEEETDHLCTAPILLVGPVPGPLTVLVAVHGPLKGLSIRMFGVPSRHENVGVMLGFDTFSKFVQRKATIFGERSQGHLLIVQLTFFFI
jgi:hypothetical protein